MKQGLFIFLILALSCLSFQNALHNYFVADDFFLIHPYIWKEVLLAFGGEGLANHRDKERPILGTPATDEQGNPIVFNETYYRPLVRVSAFVDRQIWGFNPFGYHLTNLLLHLFCSLVVYFLIKELGFDDFIALTASLLFVTHPTHVEAVTWLSGRVDVLCGFFYFSSLLFFIKYLHSRILAFSCPRAPFLWLSLTLFIGALMSKEMAITLPIMIFLITLILKGKSIFSKWKILSPFFLILGVYLLFRFLLLGGVGGYVNAQGSMHFKFDLFIMSILAWYIRQLLLPFDAALPENISALKYLVFLIYAIPGYILFRTLFVEMRKSQQEAGMGINNFTHSRFTFLIACLWIPVTLLPVMNISAERFLYIPSVGFFLLLGFGLGQRYTNHTPTHPHTYISTLSISSFLALVLLLTLNILTTREKNEDWHYAGEVVREVQSQMKMLYPVFPSDAHLFFLDLPDNYQGAYIYRNGIAGSMRLVYGNQSLQADTLISILQLKRETFIKDWHFIFQYQDRKIVHRKDLEDFLIRGERFPSMIGKTGVSAPVDIIIQSAGLQAGNLGTILVNGQDVSLQGRGYNLAVIDPQTGEIESSLAFDTHRWRGESLRMAKFIEDLKIGKIIALALKDEGALSLTAEAVEALRTLGAQEDLRSKRHWSHAIIGIKGANPGEALEGSSLAAIKLEVSGKGPPP
jgi:hypothetical protein